MTHLTDTLAQCTRELAGEDCTRELRRLVAVLLDRGTVSGLTAVIGRELRDRAELLRREYHDYDAAKVYEDFALVVEQAGDHVSIEHRI